MNLSRFARLVSRTSALVVGLGALGALGTDPAGAQTRWIPLGPEGGAVQSVAAAANGRALYAGIAGGVVFRSFNRGRSWTPSSEGLRGSLSEVRTAAVAPGTVYAATSAGVFASFDAAATWSRRSSGLPAAQLLSLEVVPANAAALYVIARTRAGDFFPFVDQVYRSFDAGASWRRTDRGLPVNDGVFDLAVDPRRPQVAFAATARGMFKTTDGGGRWQPSGLAGLRVSVVAVDRVRPELLYAVAAPTFDEPRRIWVSTNGGRTWTVVPGSALDAFAIEPHPTRAETAYLSSFTDGLLVTTNGGRTWTPIVDGLLPGLFVRVSDVAVDPTRPAVLYATTTAAGTDPGLFRSDDGGSTWQASAAGIEATQVSALALPPGGPNAVYAGLGGDGVHRLDVSAGTWTQLGLDRQQVNALVVDPQHPTTFFASAGNDGAVYRSTDEAAHWELLSTDQTNVTKTTLTVVNNAVWAAGGFGVSLWDPVNGWQQRYSSDVREIASAGAGPATRVWWNDTAGLDAGGGNDALVVSTDAGATFGRAPLSPAGEVLDFALDAQHPGFVAVGIGSTGLGTYTSGGVFLSNDGGATWRFAEVGPAKPAVFALARDPHDPQRLVAGTRGGAVFESLDGGENWTNISIGLARGAGVTDLAFDELGRLYAATAGAGVYRLRDRRP